MTDVKRMPNIPPIPAHTPSWMRAETTSPIPQPRGQRDRADLGGEDQYRRRGLKNRSGPYKYSDYNGLCPGCFLTTAESRRGGTESHRVLTVFSAVLRGFSVALCGFYGHVSVSKFISSCHSVYLFSASGLLLFTTFSYQADISRHDP